ncbi:hypothetical protein SteCoe_12193 [Stentor coeruleus]|uniref:Uncharacterized protein n=1 Tax=Stentor coeruleus TaxID=5963 RepID=A0A1R2CBI4_9CILI|nr:hypothetical protein SteCoe_12193 [Stentor coeruleus]
MENTTDPLQLLQLLDPSEWPNIPKPVLSAVICIKKCIFSQSAKITELNQKININSSNTQRRFEETDFKIIQTNTTLNAQIESTKKQISDSIETLYTEISNFKKIVSEDFDFKHKSTDTRLNIMQEQQFVMKRVLQSLPGKQEVENNIKEANSELRTSIKKEMTDYIIFPEIVTLNNRITSSNENYDKYISKLQELVEVLRNNIQVIDAQQTERQMSFEKLLRNAEKEKREDLDNVQINISAIEKSITNLQSQFNEKHKNMISLLAGVEKSSKEVLLRAHNFEEKYIEFQDKAYDLKEHSIELEDKTKDLDDKTKDLDDKTKNLEDRIFSIEDALQRYEEVHQNMENSEEMMARKQREKEQMKKIKNEKKQEKKARKKEKKKTENEEKVKELKNIYENNEKSTVKNEINEKIKINLPIVDDLQINTDALKSLNKLPIQAMDKFQGLSVSPKNFSLSSKDAYIKNSELLNDLETEVEPIRISKDSIQLGKDTSFKRRHSPLISNESQKNQRETIRINREPHRLRDNDKGKKEDKVEKNDKEGNEDKNVTGFSILEENLNSPRSKMHSDESLKKYSLKISSLEEKAKELQENMISIQYKNKSEKLELELMIKDLKDKLMWLPMNLNVIKGKTPTEARLYTIEARLRTEENSRVDQYNLLLTTINKLKADFTALASNNTQAFPQISTGRYTNRILDRNPSIDMNDYIKSEQKHSEYSQRAEKDKNGARRMSVDLEKNYKGPYIAKRGTLYDSFGY